VQLQPGRVLLLRGGGAPAREALAAHAFWADLRLPGALVDPGEGCEDGDSESEWEGEDAGSDGEAGEGGAAGSGGSAAAGGQPEVRSGGSGDGGAPSPLPREQQQQPGEEAEAPAPAGALAPDPAAEGEASASGGAGPAGARAASAAPGSPLSPQQQEQQEPPPEPRRGAAASHRRVWPQRPWPEAAFDEGRLVAALEGHRDLSPDVCASFDALLVVPRALDEIPQYWRRGAGRLGAPAAGAKRGAAELTEVRGRARPAPARGPPGTQPWSHSAPAARSRAPRAAAAAAAVAQEWSLAGLLEGGAIRVTRPTVVIDASEGPREGAILCLFSPRAHPTYAAGVGAPAGATRPALTPTPRGRTRGSRAAAAAVASSAAPPPRPPPLAPWAAAAAGWAGGGGAAPLQAAAARLYRLMASSFKAVTLRGYDSSTTTRTPGALVMAGWRANKYGWRPGNPGRGRGAVPPHCGWTAPKGAAPAADVQGALVGASAAVAAAGERPGDAAGGGIRGPSPARCACATAAAVPTRRGHPLLCALPSPPQRPPSRPAWRHTAAPSRAPRPSPASCRSWGPRRWRPTRSPRSACPRWGGERWNTNSSSSRRAVAESAERLRRPAQSSAMALMANSA
jgi:hypothetical protein